MAIVIKIYPSPQEMFESSKSAISKEYDVIFMRYDTDLSFRLWIDDLGVNNRMHVANYVYYLAYCEVTGYNGLPDDWWKMWVGLNHGNNN